MNLIVIKRRKDKTVVAIVEQGPISPHAAALAWAKASGYENFPKDLEVESGIELTTSGSVFARLMPCHELAELDTQALTITSEPEEVQHQEFEVMMRVVLAVDDADEAITIQDANEYAKAVLGVSFNDENAGNAPNGAGEDATTSMAADVVSVKRI